LFAEKVPHGCVVGVYQDKSEQIQWQYYSGADLLAEAAERQMAQDPKGVCSGFLQTEINSLHIFCLKGTESL
jgi:hypothetical protein